MSYAISDVILVPIPFSDLTSHKVRPAIVVGIPSASKDLFVVPISSQVQNTDLSLQDWRAAGLNVACGAKAQLATLESALILKRIGRLSQKRLQRSFNETACVVKSLVQRFRNADLR